MVLKEKKRVLYLEVFQYNINIVFTNSLELTSKWVDEKLDEKFDCKDTDAVCRTNKNFAYILLPFKASPGTIAHECYHCIVRMMQWLCSTEENEMMAYHIGWLVDEAHKTKKQGWV